MRKLKLHSGKPCKFTSTFASKVQSFVRVVSWLVASRERGGQVLSYWETLGVWFHRLLKQDG